MSSAGHTEQRFRTVKDSGIDFGEFIRVVVSIKSLGCIMTDWSGMEKILRNLLKK